MNNVYSAYPQIGISAYSDFYNKPEPRVWGDYWFKENLVREFVRLKYPVNNSSPKVILHLFGEPLGNLPADAYKILWIHSHPDRVTKDILEKYQKIYCISKNFVKKINDMGFSAEFLMVPTSMKPLKARKKYDIVFVGNIRQNRARKIIRDIGDTRYNIRIWGWGWKGLIPDEWYGGEYYENEKLNELYASSKIVLNDHHEDMRREGFINPRILDALASGSLVISDSVRGMGSLLNNSVVVYDKPGELGALLDKYLGNEELRESQVKKVQKTALKYSYNYACSAIIRHIGINADKVTV